MKLFLYYLTAVSVVSAFITVHDKLAAKRHARRVPEKVLLIFAALGGSVGMYLTMLLIRHKTRHMKFMVGIPLIFAAQLCVALLIMRKTALI